MNTEEDLRKQMDDRINGDVPSWCSSCCDSPFTPRQPFHCPPPSSWPPFLPLLGKALFLEKHLKDKSWSLFAAFFAFFIFFPPRRHWFYQECTLLSALIAINTKIVWYHFWGHLSCFVSCYKRSFKVNDTAETCCLTPCKNVLFFFVLKYSI